MNVFTLKCHSLGYDVRHLKCGDGFPCVSTSSFSENLQEIFLWNNGKECVLGDARGSGASSLQALVNSGALRLPRTNTAQFLTLLTVRPDFMYLEQNWNHPLTAPPALSCIASIYTLHFYAKSLSCILNTSLNPSRLTAVTKLTPTLIESPPSPHRPRWNQNVPASLLARLVTTSHGDAVAASGWAVCHASSLDVEFFWAGRAAAWERVSAVAMLPHLLPLGLYGLLVKLTCTVWMFDR